MSAPDVLFACVRGTVMLLHVPLRAEEQRLFQQVAAFVQPLLPARRGLQRTVQLVVALLRGVVHLVGEMADRGVVAE